MKPGQHRRSLLVRFVFSTLILAVSYFVSYKAVTGLLDSQQWVDHTQSVLLKLENVISRMKDAETGQRGFLLTNEEEFLEPYRNSRLEVLQLVNEAQELTTDNSVQQKDFPKLKVKVDVCFQILQNMINSKRGGHSASLDSLTLSKKYMDDIRLMVSTMKERENMLMMTRVKEYRAGSRTAIVVIIFTTLLSIVLTVLYYFRLRNDYRELLTLERELVAKDRQLKHKIAVVEKIAVKMAEGDYSARLDPTDLSD